ncbi:MAG: GFA family protein [Halomonas sp.]|nr:GFA family protein [Halomonas sp.]MBP5980197.1 GFA family protein [Halomonas sp.]
MASDMQHLGKCLCGAVSVTINVQDNHISACHCSICRRWGGGPFLAIESILDIRFTGDEYITTFSSSEWAERGFCKQCGTHLFYRLKQAEHYAIPVGLLEGSDWVFAEQIFIDHKPEFYIFANDTHMLTEQEVFAQHANKS